MVDIGDSTPPKEALSAFEIAIRLDRLVREVREMRSDLGKAKENDLRFDEMHRQFNTLKKYVGAAVVAALGALGAGVGTRISNHVPEYAQPEVRSSGASTFPDRAVAPDAGRR
jgi:hypothetical protein